MKLYLATPNSARSTIPQFEIRGRYLYPTHHLAPSGNALPWFEIKGRYYNQLSTHPKGLLANPSYEVKGNLVYPTPSNHDHPPGLAIYKIEKM